MILNSVKFYIFLSSVCLGFLQGLPFPEKMYKQLLISTWCESVYAWCPGMDWSTNWGCGHTLHFVFMEKHILKMVGWLVGWWVGYLNEFFLLDVVRVDQVVLSASHKSQQAPDP